MSIESDEVRSSTRKLFHVAGPDSAKSRRPTQHDESHADHSRSPERCPVDVCKLDRSADHIRQQHGKMSFCKCANSEERLS